MQQAARNCYNMLENDGMAIFIIGDTELHGVKIEKGKKYIMKNLSL